MRMAKNGPAVMKVLLLLVAGFIVLDLFAVTTRNSNPQKKRKASVSENQRRSANPKETFCGADVCPKQVLVKFSGCERQDDLGNFTKQLEDFSRTLTKDGFLTFTQVGRRCLFLTSSSTLNVQQLMQFMTTLKMNRTQSVNKLLSSYGLSDLSVDYIEPNFMVQFDSNPEVVPLDIIPNDDYFVRDSLWGLGNMTRQAMDIDAVRAWQFATGSEQVVVGVLDSGIAYDHEDLTDNMWRAPRDFTVQVAGGPLTCLKGSHGYNALGKTWQEKCNPDDKNGHGTLVSGIIGARGNNKVGVVGVNWKVKLMGLRIGNGSGTCISNAIDAIDFALQVKEQFPEEANLRVLNNSWGYLLTSECGIKSQSLREKIAEAGNHDILVVGSAGQNGGNNNDDNPHYPSSFDLPNVIAVTALNKNGDLTNVQGNPCNHGIQRVHLGAPGYGIYSTYIEPRRYYHGAQTSVAAPFVSGAAALMLSVPSCAKLHAHDLKRLIIEGAVETPSMEKTASRGRLNVYNSIGLCGK